MSYRFADSLRVGSGWKFIFGLKLYMFRTVPLSIIRSYSLYIQQWYISYRFADSLRAGSGWKFILGLKLYMFRTVPLSIIRSYSLYIQQWYISYRFADSLRAGSGYNILILLASCLQTSMTYTIAVCTVKKLLMMEIGTVRNM